MFQDLCNKQVFDLPVNKVCIRECNMLLFWKLGLEFPLWFVNGLISLYQALPVGIFVRSLAIHTCLIVNNFIICFRYQTIKLWHLLKVIYFRCIVIQRTTTQGKTYRNNAAKVSVVCSTVNTSVHLTLLRMSTSSFTIWVAISANKADKISKVKHL